MSDRRRLVDLAVVGVSAAVFAASILVVADVDAGRARSSATTSAPTSATPADILATTPTATIPPIAGLEPAPRPAARRVVVVRRSRAS